MPVESFPDNRNGELLSGAGEHRIPKGVRQLPAERKESAGWRPFGARLMKGRSLKKERTASVAMQGTGTTRMNRLTGTAENNLQRLDESFRQKVHHSTGRYC